MGSEARNALIVGNSDYLSVARLESPKNNALLSKSKLDNLGFTTRLSINAKQQTSSSLVNQSVEDAITDEDLFFAFFAEHAVQIDGQNFLLGTDCDFDTGSVEVRESVSVEVILDQLAN